MLSYFGVRWLFRTFIETKSYRKEALKMRFNWKLLFISCIVSFLLVQSSIFQANIKFSYKGLVGFVFFGVIIFCLFSKFLTISYNYTKRTKILFVVFYFFIAGILQFAIPIHSNFVHVKVTATVIIASLGNILFCFLLLSFLALLFSRKNVQLTNAKPSKLNWLYVLPCIGIWMFYLLAFYPGLMSPDSFAQWSEASSLKLYDNHPAFHTTFIWLITKIWYSPAAVAAA